jgi:hypothetical protein
MSTSPASSPVTPPPPFVLSTASVSAVSPSSRRHVGPSAGASPVVRTAGGGGGGGGGGDGGGGGGGGGGIGASDNSAAAAGGSPSVRFLPKKAMPPPKARARTPSVPKKGGTSSAAKPRQKARAPAMAAPSAAAGPGAVGVGADAGTGEGEMEDTDGEGKAAARGRTRWTHENEERLLDFLLRLAQREGLPAASRGVATGKMKKWDRLAAYFAGVSGKQVKDKWGNMRRSLKVRGRISTCAARAACKKVACVHVRFVGALAESVRDLSERHRDDRVD